MGGLSALPPQLLNFAITQLPNHPITQFACGTLALITIRPPKVASARDIAREILTVVPLVMRAVAAELRASGELPAPAHFGLLSMLSAQPHARTLTELAAFQGVSLPTMSNSISALVDRGWVQRTGAGGDRRQVVIEVTPTGRAALDRVSACAERHLAEVLAPLDARSRRRVHTGLGLLRQVFGGKPAGRERRARKPAAGRTHGRG